MAVDLDEFFDKGRLEGLVDLRVPVLLEVVQRARPVLELLLREQVTVLQEKEVHLALNMVIAYVSQSFGHHDIADHDIVLADFFNISEFLVSEEIPFD